MLNTIVYLSNMKFASSLVILLNQIREWMPSAPDRYTNHYRQSVPDSVGTGGGCGEGWGPCACLLCEGDPVGFAKPGRIVWRRGQAQGPTLPRILPLSLLDGGDVCSNARNGVKVHRVQAE